MAKMKVEKFLAQAKKSLDSHTVYGSGAFGASIGNYPSQLSRYYDNTLKRCGQSAANKVKTEAAKPPCWAFDCCGLIKGLIWGWNAIEKSTYGGAVYESNGLDDYGADDGKGNLIYYCTDVSTDFSKIVPGEMLWIQGHVGIYIGNGEAIECTTAWTGNVLKSVVTNVKAAKSGEYGRKWTKHGKLSQWIDYTQPVVNKFYVEIGPFDSSSAAISMQNALKTLGTTSTITTKSK